LAVETGLEARGVPESQEICFVADDDHKRFLRERLGDRPGAIVDLGGRPLGRHSGTYNYTVGQRKGLGIASPTPLYVVRVEAEKALVVAGPAEECEVGEVVLEDVVRHRPGNAGSGALQVRSNGPAVSAHLREKGRNAAGSADDRQVSILLEEPASGVAPGQTAVLYDGDAVVLAGTVRSTERWSGGPPGP
jgi:tRNA-specific 2-thiouridylase